MIKNLNTVASGIVKPIEKNSVNRRRRCANVVSNEPFRTLGISRQHKYVDTH
jgi:hypothetical protein